MKVWTVTGPIEPAEVGPTMMHEHVLHDWVRDWPSGHVGDLRIDSYDEIVDDEEVLAEELIDYRAAGGSALVEMTDEGLGAMPAGMRRVAIRAGLHVIKSYGWYREDYLPDIVKRTRSDALADHIVEQFANGIGDTGVQPGIIGELATGRGFMTPGEERVFRAAARAQRSIGCSISTHTEHYGELALEQVAFLRGEGVPAERIVIGHLGERAGIDDVLAVAETGVFVQVDFIGSTHLGFGSDERRAANVAALVAAGRASQVTLSMNLSSNSDLRTRGGIGYGYLLRTFLPMLRDRGVAEADITTMLVTNPRRILAF